MPKVVFVLLERVEALAKLSISPVKILKKYPVEHLWKAATKFYLLDRF